MTVDMNDRAVRAGTLLIQTRRDGSTCTAALAGELGRAENDGGAFCRIVLDMTELEFIDSTGISILVAVHRVPECRRRSLSA